jgi:hypothetical protein
VCDLFECGGMLYSNDCCRSCESTTPLALRDYFAYGAFAVILLLLLRWSFSRCPVQLL